RGQFQTAGQRLRDQGRERFEAYLGGFQFTNPRGTSQAAMADYLGTDVHYQAGRSRITVRNLDGGGKEFVLPALRNFREKMSFTIIALIATAALALFLYIALTLLSDLPFVWARFFAINFFFSFFAVLGLVALAFGFLC